MPALREAGDVARRVRRVWSVLRVLVRSALEVDAGYLIHHERTTKRRK
jgi:hypothetical protein